jgi:multidrug efflux pump subunit AcrA (membrane-fusion protein)
MTAPAQTITIAEVDTRAKVLADARAVLNDRVTSFDDELRALRNRRLPGIKSAVQAVKEAESTLEQAIVAAPALFDNPRTIVLHGLRIGFVKGRGKIEWTDEAGVVEKIEKLFPDQAKVLVKVVKSVRKKALGGLKSDELKRLGCVVRESGDHVFIEPVADQVEKLVNRLLKEEAPDDGGE